MTSRIPVLEGDDWEQFCTEALENRHGTDFQKVPARFRGDYGIDGYIRGSTLYQFYGDEAGASAVERSKAQQRKLATDIPKLKANREPIEELAGSGITEYVFLVSSLEDKAVVERAEELARMVKGWNLSYLSPDFKISVKDKDFLAHEWDLLYGSLQEKLDLRAPATSQTQINSWADEEDDLVSTLTEKLSAIDPPGVTAPWVEKFIRHRLHELDVLGQLRGKGSIWQRAREMKAERENALESPRLTTSPVDDLQRLCDEFRQEIQTEIPSMPYAHASALAWGAAGDWLMRCPLSYSDG